MSRVLVVDDDPISLRFLAAALEQFGCKPIAASTLSAALDAGAVNTFDLVLLDRNLPDGSGSELLAALRERGVSCAAIATSAEMYAELEAQLRCAGFVACIAKPVGVTALQQAVQPWLPCKDVPLLDDDTALLAIGGNREALQMLRGMLVQELAALRDDVMNDRIASGPLLDRLHRLRASCGFCGTPKLAAAAIALERSLRMDPAFDDAPLQAFLARCAETIESLSP
jgi:CheY-like chemotaxis protein